MFLIILANELGQSEILPFRLYLSFTLHWYEVQHISENSSFSLFLETKDISISCPHSINLNLA